MTSSKRQIVVLLLALLIMAATVFALASANSATTHDAYAAKAGGPE